MAEEQKMMTIEKEELLNRVSELHESGYRLVQISCTSGENFELNYSFDKSYAFVNLRYTVSRENPEIPSISGIYWNAFLYENEIHDLFGVGVKNMAIDYRGEFYRTSQEAPFSKTPGEKGDKTA